MWHRKESLRNTLSPSSCSNWARALQNVDLVRSADIQMRELSRLTKETIHLGALDEDSIVYIHKIDSMYNLRMYSRIGRRHPLYSTAIGKVLLAWRDRSEVEQILDGVEYKRSTERTITSTEGVAKSAGWRSRAGLWRG